VRATGLIQDSHLVPGLVKIDGYTRTSRLITDNFDVTTGNLYSDPDDRAANFYEFPYDWRRDNRANARLLKSLLDKRLKCWREQSGAADAKVIFMAHSMGGLVCRYDLEVLEGWQDCRALITFGTPYRGSLKAVDFLANGYKKLFLDLTEVMRSFTSIYQLLPIYPVLNINGNYHRISEVNNLPNIDQIRAQDALAFHREIEAAVKQHWQDETYRRSFTVVPISGVQQPTLQSAVLQNGRLTATEDIPAILRQRSDLGDGDGTVPKVSAIPLEHSDSFDNFFIAEQHGALQNQTQVLENLLNILRMSQYDLASVRGGEPQAAISLSLDDLYLADEPVFIRAQVLGTSATQLTANITAVSADRPVLDCNFEQRQDDWMLLLDLPAGLYRIMVKIGDTDGQLPMPVHGLFEVVR
jgi:pimeloyl-ACP methyl ester carboxylesterase